MLWWIWELEGDIAQCQHEELEDYISNNPHQHKPEFGGCLTSSMHICGYCHLYQLPVLFSHNSSPFGCQSTIILNPMHCHKTLYGPRPKVGKGPRPPSRAYFFPVNIKNDYQTVIGPIRVSLGLFWMLVKMELVTFIKYNEWSIFVWLWEPSYCHSGTSLIDSKAKICRSNDGQDRNWKLRNINWTSWIQLHKRH